MSKSGIQEINLHLTYFSSPGNEGCRGTELISLNLWLSGVQLSLECLHFKSPLLGRGVLLLRRTLFTAGIEVLVLSTAAILEANIMKVCKVKLMVWFDSESKMRKTLVKPIEPGCFYFSYPLNSWCSQTCKGLPNCFTNT